MEKTIGDEEMKLIVKTQFTNLKKLISSVDQQNLDDITACLYLLPKEGELEIKAVKTMMNEAMKHAVEKKNLEICLLLLKEKRVDCFVEPMFGFSLFVLSCRTGFHELISHILSREPKLSVEKVKKGIEQSVKMKQELVVQEILMKVKCDSMMLEEIKKMDIWNELENIVKNSEK